MDGSASYKRASLLHFGLYYDRKKFYETGPWTYRACSLSASGQPVARKRDLKESVPGMSVSLLNHCMVKLFGVRQESTRVRNSRIGS